MHLYCLVKIEIHEQYTQTNRETLKMNFILDALISDVICFKYINFWLEWI